MNPQKPNSYDDDIDDIMASIMQGQGSNAEPAQQKRVHKKLVRSRRISHSQELKPTGAPTRPAVPKPRHQSKRRTNSRYLARILPASLLIILTMASLLLWKGPVSSIFKPSSPFSSELAAKMEVPLLYPTKLPGSYKIELNSITQPEAAVVIYAITDDSDNKVNISLQRQPKGIRLEPLYEALHTKKQLDTKFGTITRGTSEDNIDIVNILTGETWVIITSSRGALDDTELRLIIDSLAS